MALSVNWEAGYQAPPDAGAHHGALGSSRKAPFVVDQNAAYKAIPVLPLRGGLLFPYASMRVAVGRLRSVAAVETAMKSQEKSIVVVAAKKAGVKDAPPEDLSQIGTEAVIKRVERFKDHMQLVVLGVRRVQIHSYVSILPYLLARVSAYQLATGQRP